MWKSKKKEEGIIIPFVQALKDEQNNNTTINSTVGEWMVSNPRIVYNSVMVGGGIMVVYYVWPLVVLGWMWLPWIWIGCTIFRSNPMKYINLAKMVIGGVGEMWKWWRKN